MPSFAINYLRRLKGQGVGAEFARKASGAFLANAFGLAFALITQLIAARFLGVTDYGMFMYVLAWVNLLVICATLGFDGASIRFIAAYGGQNDFAKMWLFGRFALENVLFLSVAISCVSVVVLLALGDWLTPQMARAFKFAVLLLPLFALQQLGQAFLLARKRVVAAQLFESFPRNLILILSILFGSWVLKIKFDAHFAILSTILGSIITIIYLGTFIIKILPSRTETKLTAELKRDWVKASFMLFLISGSQVLLARADLLLLGIYLTPAECGVYAVASRISTLITFGITAINAVLAPTIADFYFRQKRQELQNVITIASLATLLYAIPALGCVWIFGKKLLLLFGPSFGSGYPALLLLSVGQLVIALTGSVGFLLTMTGHQSHAAGIIGAMAVLNIALNLLFIPHFGIVGAALATTAATVARSCVLNYFVKSKLGIHASILTTLIGKLKAIKV